MNAIDAFNGDADGLLARHQFRLTHPLPPESITLVTGVKRDIALLDRTIAMQQPGRAGQIAAFDISFDRNALAVDALLKAGAYITYFDHHRASLRQEHARLNAYIDESPDVCTSLLVDRYCKGAHHLWAIAAAFGDNLAAVGQRLSAEASLSPARVDQLKLLGECLNYNAYGESVEDLHFHPAALASRLQPYNDAFMFIEREDVLTCLQGGRDNDMAKALAIEAVHASPVAAIYVLPDHAWSRRISGAFANRLVHTYPQRAHVVMTSDAKGTATVSIRAPASMPHGAERVASRFENGGGRAIAAGIESFPVDRLPLLIDALDQTYR
jgi:hypothetical protein